VWAVFKIFQFSHIGATPTTPQSMIIINVGQVNAANRAFIFRSLQI
jgi:hypothetical protein